MHKRKNSYEFMSSLFDFTLYMWGGVCHIHNHIFILFVSLRAAASVQSSLINRKTFLEALQKATVNVSGSAIVLTFHLLCAWTAGTLPLLPDGVRDSPTSIPSSAVCTAAAQLEVKPTVSKAEADFWFSELFLEIRKINLAVTGAYWLRLILLLKERTFNQRFQ